MDERSKQKISEALSIAMEFEKKKVDSMLHQLDANQKRLATFLRPLTEAFEAVAADLKNEPGLSSAVDLESGAAEISIVSASSKSKIYVYPSAVYAHSHTYVFEIHEESEMFATSSSTKRKLEFDSSEEAIEWLIRRTSELVMYERALRERISD
ncbi:MAG: hypothetical protein SF172_05650 [Burkholderiales bacterium]|nr:hypothetical protein [Burkholderiales bacterium]